MSIADYMRPPVSLAEPVYPLVHDGGERIQIVYSETTYGMLLRHDRYWCGYTLLSQAQAEMIDSWRPMLGASYLGPANTPITWYAPDKFGILNGPSSLLIHKGGDFWIGFHESVKDMHPPHITRLHAMAHLANFVTAVQKVIQADANPPV